MSKFESQASIDDLPIDPRSAPMGYGNLEINEVNHLQIHDDIDNMLASLRINDNKNSGRN